MDRFDIGNTKDTLKEVLDERYTQELKWGQQNHTPDRWITILMEEVGEVARSILEKNKENYREELIQVAAVAVAMVESFDRNKDGEA